MVAAIVPWNFPLLLAAWKVAPALACGNTVILKPASQTPLTALALGELALEVGLPPGVLNVVTGAGSTIGQALVEHPGIDKIAFTGDTSTGKGIMRSAAETLKKITLELGGKSPNIVLPDADIEAAIRGATIGIFYGKGSAPRDRGCSSTAPSRTSSSTSWRRVRRRRPGIRWTEEDAVGRNLVAQAARDRAGLHRIGQTGRRDAGRRRRATDIGTGKGYFLQPTVFADVTPGMRISREEIFGPVLAAIDFADLDEAIAKANDTQYGLAAGVWTRDIKKAHYVARKLQAGTVWVNTYNVYDTAAPSGGYKQSGFGREMSAHALEHYTQIKTVWVDLNQ